MKATKWWQNTAVYQIYPKSFNDTTGSGTGDLRGITEKLDYLKDLGAGALWLTPVYPSPMVDNGYDISDYTGINPQFGTLAGMEELIAEAKKRDMRIVMDLVYNHSSDQHPWFIESKSSRNNAKSGWYIWRDAKPDGSAPTNWRGIFGGSAWTYCAERDQYYLHTFAEAQPDLNWENPEVRAALFAAANFWLDKGVGGFRIDAITYIKKPAFFEDGTPDAADGMVSVHTMTANTPGILDFLHEFRREVFDGHDIFTVGEANGVSVAELPDWVGENGVFSMLFEFAHVLVPYEDGECWSKMVPWKLTKLKGALSASQEGVAKEGWYPIYFENHDRARSVNYFFPKGGDARLAAKALATILMTLRGTPFIYEGEELGMTNVKWDTIDAYDDISSHGQYELALKEGFSPQRHCPLSTSTAVTMRVRRCSGTIRRTPDSPQVRRGCPQTRIITQSMRRQRKRMRTPCSITTSRSSVCARRIPYCSTGSMRNCLPKTSRSTHSLVRKAIAASLRQSTFPQRRHSFPQDF